MLENKRILLVGGTGSWGITLLEQLLNTGAAQIKVFARNEHNMVSMQQAYPDKRVRAILGDIRDPARLLQACADVDIIFHLAAIKHVPICEQSPMEAVATNVTGTQNLIDCAIKSGVEKVIYASTDKAVAPHCAYGCTKLLGERLILSANAQSKDSKFIVFRSGNLLGSSGSVIPLFQRQIERSRCVSLTDKRMNRFFIPITRAAELLIETALRGAGGEVFLPRMDALSIHDVAKYLLCKNGLDEGQIRVTGIRPGETLNESMLTQEESQSVYRISEGLFAFIGKDDHSWAANGFVETGSYPRRSQDAVLPYPQACDFLQAANM